MTREELANSITELAQTNPGLDLKKKALAEIASAGVEMPNVEQIVDGYPDFDSVHIRLTGEGLCVSLFVDAKQMADNPTIVEKVVDLIMPWVDKGEPEDK